MEKPNIILIILDTFRADKLLTNNEGRELTPFIKTLMKNSYYFENCIANSPWTVPSHINIFTGLYATQMKNLTKKVDTLGNKIPVLTEILKDWGYHTICFTENPHINKKEGFARGFEIFIDNWQSFLTHPKRFWVDRIEKILPISKIASRVSTYIKKRIESSDVILFKIKKILKNLKNQLFWKKILSNKTTTLDQLEKIGDILKKKNNTNPFYLFLNIMATHYPYVPTRQILNKFKIRNKQIKTIRNFLLTNPKDLINLTESKPLSENKIDIIKKLYNTSVFYADQIVKELFSILENLGLLENSYVVITSDHGEHLCDESDHFLCDHTTYFSLYESLLRVPLLIYHKNYKNKVIKNQVQLKDLYHTILSFTNHNSTNIKYFKKEKSLLYQIETNSTPKFILGEYLKPKNKVYNLIHRYRNIIKKNLISKIINDVYFLRTEKLKFIDFNSIKELYQIETDPQERFNITGKNLKVQKEIKKAYDLIKEKINKKEDLIELTTEKEKDLIKRSIKLL
ncbi:MAG: sulfatase-like hydrolase/transferase [Candidatus Hodarchaeota archaeon]